MMVAVGNPLPSIEEIKEFRRQLVLQLNSETIPVVRHCEDAHRWVMVYPPYSLYREAVTSLPGNLQPTGLYNKIIHIGISETSYCKEIESWSWSMIMNYITQHDNKLEFIFVSELNIAGYDYIWYLCDMHQRHDQNWNKLLVINKGMILSPQLSNFSMMTILIPVFIYPKLNINPALMSLVCIFSTHLHFLFRSSNELVWCMKQVHIFMM